MKFSRVDRKARYRGFDISVDMEDDSFYYVSASGRRLPRDLFVDMERTQIAEYIGKIPKATKDLEFLEGGNTGPVGPKNPSDL